MTWEERWHPLREEWVIIAAHRQDRPWNGETLTNHRAEVPAHVSDCYLCPGNLRVSGKRNDDYTGTFVFDNDHPCVGQTAPTALEQPRAPYQNQSARGIARVLCYSPRHNLSLAELEVSEIENLLHVWQDQYLDLARHQEINHVLIFENRGEAVGVSNPHPHCQIYATNFVFKTIETEARVSDRYLRDTGRILFQDILKAEVDDGRRIICATGSAIAFLPYFARYAYEVYVAPRQTHASIASLSQNEVKEFASTLKCLLVKLDNLWQMPFPYVLTLHQSPTNGLAHEGFHFHIEIHPPLRQPNLLKYLAGPEIGGGNFLSDTAPEEKAAELRIQPEVHYKESTLVGGD